MELVAASKMKRAVSSTLASRLYASYSSQILSSIAANIEKSSDPFWNEQTEGKTLVVLITSNRGLCGGYNSQIVKLTLHKLKDLEAGEVDMVTIGKKGDVAMRRINQNITSVFTEIPDVNIGLRDITPLSKIIMNEYRAGKYKKVYIAYTHFTSALSQKPIIKQLLPISKTEIREAIASTPKGVGVPTANVGKNLTEYLFEGDFDSLITSLAEKITRMQIYQMILESNASEQSSRMVAMKNASEASGEMIDDLTLVFNKARQANITREISEISAGMVSIN